MVVTTVHSRNNLRLLAVICRGGKGQLDAEFIGIVYWWRLTRKQRIKLEPETR